MDQDNLELTEPVTRCLRAELPSVARSTAEAVIAEVPGYRDLRGLEGATLDQAVELALRGFLSVASESGSEDPAYPLQPALDAAYALGQGEVRSGRTMDVLLSAYRVGAKVAWREWSRVAIDAGVGSGWLAHFAELTFSYIDELSAASVSGYAEEVASRDQAQQRKLEHLTRGLLAGGPVEALQADADRAGWRPPTRVTAALLPAIRARGIRSLIEADSLELTDDLPGLTNDADLVALLIPTIGASGRDRLKDALAGRAAIVGPERPWFEAGLSYARAVQVHGLTAESDDDAPIDADDYLVDLVINSDPEALSDLRAHVLSPLDSLRPSTSEKLTETLRAWLLHQGRREEIAAALMIHPQTVRYRMGQLRDLYGDRLNDPEVVLAATVALGLSVSARS